MSLSRRSLRVCSCEIDSRNSLTPMRIQGAVVADLVNMTSRVFVADPYFDYSIK